MTGPTEPEGQSKPFEPMPSAPALNEQELGQVDVARPKLVDNAFMLWMIGAGLYLVSVVVASIGDAGRESLEQSLGRPPTDDEVNAARLFGLVLGLLFVGLFVLFAFNMRRGKSWARIALTVLGGISVVLNLISISAAGALNLLFSLVVVVLILVAIYFMFRPDANQYFAAGKARR